MNAKSKSFFLSRLICEPSFVSSLVIILSISVLPLVAPLAARDVERGGAGGAIRANEADGDNDDRLLGGDCAASGTTVSCVGESGRETMG